MSLSSTSRDAARGYNALDTLLYNRILGAATAPFHAWMMNRLQPELGGARRILDVGCGAGQFTLQLAAQQPEAEFDGIDLSASQIARARRGAAGHSRVRFHEASALDLPFEDGRFDLLFSNGSLKYWPDPERGLRECARVLAPGGRMLVFEADRGCRHDDAIALTRAWGVPGPLHKPVVMFIRTVLAGGSLDLADARAMLERIDGLDGEVRRAEGLPALLIDAQAR